MPKSDRGASGRPPGIQKEDVGHLRHLLRNNPRDLLLFDLITQTGLPVKYLLQLKVSDLKGLESGESLFRDRAPKQQGQTGVITATIEDSIQTYLKILMPGDDDYVFKSRKGSRPLNLSSVSTMINAWFVSAGLPGQTGIRALRRIWQQFYRSSGESGDQRRDSIEQLRPVEKSSLQDRVYQELLQAIVAGKIPPGEPLTTQKIARQMKVSPMPVREAMSRLGAAGFITPQKKRSSRVKRLSQQNMMEILDIRLALETMAVEKACRVGRQTAFGDLDAIHRQYMAVIDQAGSEYQVDEILRLNKLFHHTIYREADMPVLLGIIEGLWDQISPYMHILMRRSYGAFKRVNTLSHGRILAGFKQQDVGETCKWLRTDLKEAGNLIIVEFQRGRL